MIIYVIHNFLTEKMYVGQHRGDKAEERLKQHLYEAAHGGKTYLHRAIRKYGASNFQVQILCKMNCSLKELDDLERIWIILLNSRNAGYNLARGGTLENHVGTKGYKHTEDFKRSVSLRFKNKKLTPEHRAQMRHDGMLGKHQSELQRKTAGERSRNRVWTQTSRDKLSLACIGKECSDSLREKRQTFMKGNTNVLGKHWKAPTNSTRNSKSSWIYSIELQEERFATETDNLLSQGWIKGRLPGAKRAPWRAGHKGRTTKQDLQH